ncbi:hypothetical protein RRG08_023812 [Elysia crispata]|uniref:Uncharacterized protein n=1 Tax=Elysia crispata TaxID=231223 RepID=A0AAE1DNL2_9GAST|nr:hypothetical protein RRG08_023812 [Elysia crispata]
MWSGMRVGERGRCTRQPMHVRVVTHLTPHTIYYSSEARGLVGSPDNSDGQEVDVQCASKRMGHFKVDIVPYRYSLPATRPACVLHKCCDMKLSTFLCPSLSPLLAPLSFINCSRKFSGNWTAAPLFMAYANSIKSQDHANLHFNGSIVGNDIRAFYLGPVKLPGLCLLAHPVPLLSCAMRPDDANPVVLEAPLTHQNEGLRLHKIHDLLITSPMKGGADKDIINYHRSRSTELLPPHQSESTSNDKDKARQGGGVTTAISNQTAKGD